MREALKDISRRPDPDITGAIQHAMAASEATAREATNQPNPTFGKLVPMLGLPRPLDQAVHKLRGGMLPNAADTSASKNPSITPKPS